MSAKYGRAFTAMLAAAAIATNVSGLSMNRRETVGSHGMAEQPAKPDQVDYTKDTETEIDGPPFNIASSVTGGGTLVHSESYAVGYSVEIGVEASLDVTEIFSLGASFSISMSTESGSEDAAQYECPEAAEGDDQWQCSMAITPKLVAVAGNQATSANGGEGDPVNEPYTVNFPRTTKENILKFEAQLCSCPNMKGCMSPFSSRLCPENC